MRKDSPYCPNCMTYANSLANTYKLLGKPAFRCGSCKGIFPHDQFDPEDFMWKSDRIKWEGNMKSKQIDLNLLKKEKK